MHTCLYARAHSGTREETMKHLFFLLCGFGFAPFALADGHGPVFGLATPTNSQGEWSFDAGIFGRNTSIGSQASIRGLIAYGFTLHLTLSFTLPAVVGDTPLPPPLSFDNRGTIKMNTAVVPVKKRSVVLSYLSLFTSVGTQLSCALRPCLSCLAWEHQ